MGQEISAIITNQTVEIEKNIVHFVEKGCTIIPLNVSPSTINLFVEEAKKYQDLYALINFLKLDDDWKDDTEMITIVEIIENLALHSFMVELHSEWAGLDAELSFVAIRNDKIISESVMSNYDDFSWEIYDKYKGLFGLKFYWWANEDRYYFYSYALEEYNNLLKLQGNKEV